MYCVYVALLSTCLFPFNSFEQFDVVMPKKRLTSFGLAVTQERWAWIKTYLSLFSFHVFNMFVSLNIEHSSKLIFHCFPSVFLTFFVLGGLITTMLETSLSAASLTRFSFRSTLPITINLLHILSFLQPMIEFLSCIHIHSEGEDLNEISKTKSIRMVPTLCGMASTDKCDNHLKMLLIIFFWLQKIS